MQGQKDASSIQGLLKGGLYQVTKACLGRAVSSMLGMGGIQISYRGCRARGDANS